MDALKIKIRDTQVKAIVRNGTTTKVNLSLKAVYTTAVFQWVEPPATRNSLGVVGQQSFDDDYYYLCVGTNQWARTLLMKGW
jgi:hypothetical protein